MNPSIPTVPCVKCGIPANETQSVHGIAHMNCYKELSAMATNMNIHTGDKMMTKPPSKAYADGWDRVFGKPSIESRVKHVMAQAHAMQLDEEMVNMFKEADMKKSPKKMPGKKPGKKC